MKKTKKPSPAETQPGGVEMSKVQAAEYRRIQKRLMQLDRAEIALCRRRDKTVASIFRKAEAAAARARKAAALEIKGIAKEEAALLRRRCILEGRLS